MVKKEDLVKDEYQHQVDSEEGSSTLENLQEKLESAEENAWKLTKAGFSMFIAFFLLYIVLQLIWL